MPTNTVKPIMITYPDGVESKTLTNLLEDVRNLAIFTGGDEVAQAQAVWKLHSHFHSIVDRLKLEVKRHKKTKKEVNAILNARQTLAEMTCNEVDVALGEGYRHQDESLSEAVARLKSEKEALRNMLSEAGIDHC